MLRLQYVGRRREPCRLFFIDTGHTRQLLVSLYSFSSDAKSPPSRHVAGRRYLATRIANKRCAPSSLSVTSALMRLSHSTSQNQTETIL